MRNFYLLVMLICAMAANAQSISSSMSYWSTAELDGESEDLYGTLRVSDNGEYAVGYDGENIYTAYIWERATGELTFASEYTGSKREGASVLNDVSNNGKMVGATRASYTHEDGTTNTCWLPAFRYVDSEEYTVLPCPDYCVTKYPYDLDYNSFAYRVSPDGKVICGEMYLTDPILGNSRYEPYLWFLDDDDNVIDTQSFYGLEYGNQGVEIYDMSDDGSIIVGMVTSARGDFMPMYIMDGELHTLAGPDLVWSNDNNRWEQQDENGDYIDEEVWEGIASSIDGDGNIYYYNIDGQGQATYGIYNVYTGELTSYAQYVVVGNKGVIVGMSSVVESPIDFNLAGIYTVLSMSDDATVFAGGKYCSSAWGDAFLCPAVVVLDESPIVEEELEEEAEEPSDEELNEDEPSDEEEVEDGINYTYSSANGPAREYYNLAGQRVTAGYKGLIINNGRKVLKY